MLKFFHPFPDRHFVDGGRVNCPLRGMDVEADVCGSCRWLTEMRTDKRGASYVRCRPPAPIFAPE